MELHLSWAQKSAAAGAERMEGQLAEAGRALQDSSAQLAVLQVCVWWGEGGDGESAICPLTAAGC